MLTLARVVLVVIGAGLIALSGPYARNAMNWPWSRFFYGAETDGGPDMNYWGHRLGAILTGVMSILIGTGLVEF